MTYGNIPHVTKANDMTFRTWKFTLLSSVIIAMAGNASATPTQFTATATVQNAVTITETTPMNFGTIFATATHLGIAAGAATVADSNKLTFAPTTGAASQTLGAGSVAPAPPQVLSLGGVVSGQYTAPGLPSNATVKINFTNASDLAVTPTTAALAECEFDTTTAALAANRVVLASTAGDPTIAFFCVDAFTSNRTALLAPAAGYALGFGVTTLTFDLGATLIQQVPATAITRTYAPGAYSGIIGMEVTFP